MSQLDGRNYLRNTVLALAKIDKPFILCGKYLAHENLGYVTYTDIRPYVPEDASTNRICDHLNVLGADIEKYVAVRSELNGKKDFLICRAVTYPGRNYSVRGGIILTDELGIPPAISTEYPHAREIIDAVPKNRYVDFFTFAEGRYAYYGKNHWLNGHFTQIVNGEEKQKQKIVKNEQKEISLEEFMKMYYEENPLWIPPIVFPKHIDAKVFLLQIIPQKNLRNILDRQPSLRREVYQEFLKKI